MSILPMMTAAPVPKTNNVSKIAISYAVIIVVMVVLQLFTFDDFLILFTSFNFPGGIRYAHFVAAFLIVAEVFALPFLLRMRVSTAFRWTSMVLGWCVALIWVKLTVWLVLQGSLAMNVGFLGTVVDVVPGWWAIFVSIGFGILAGWASWGMWPGHKRPKRVVIHRS